MYLDYVNDIIKYYRARERSGELPHRLMRPTPGSVKAECLSVCEARLQKEDLRILTAFFTLKNDHDTMLRAIDRCDRDRFKPLVNFLKGITGSTDDLNIELLAWLIDFPGRPFKMEGYSKMPDDIADSVVQEKTEIEGSSEAYPATDNTDTAVGTAGQELTKTERTKSRLVQPARFTTTRRKVISVVISVLLLALLGFYFTNKDRSAGFPGKDPQKMDDVEGDHTDTGTAVVSPGGGRLVDGNHKTGSGLTMKEGSLPQQAQEGKVNKSTIVEKHEPDPAAANLVSAAVDFVSFTNPESNADIAMLIIDSNRKNMTSVASAVANLYRNKSYSVSTGVFTSAFIHSKYVDEIAGGDISILSKLVLPSSLKYIVIGKYRSGMDSGQRTRFICRAGLDVTVISVSRKTQVDGFELTVANGYDDEEHARAGAIEKLVDQYQVRSTSIKLN